RLHPRERDRVLRGGGRGGTVAGRVRCTPLLLLQRAQPLLPGGGEVPRGSTLTAQQPENNIVRVAIQALSAIAGGAQSLHTNSFDEALALPSEHAAHIALRTQQILAHEGGTTDTADPLGGSYYIEALTSELESRAWELI